MNIPKDDLRFEYMRGTGPGGQKRNKACTACRITHLPTGITAYSDERSQSHSRKTALKVLTERLLDVKRQAKAADKKTRRDQKIHDHTVVRTYDYSRGVVIDHRTHKKASLKNVLDKGKIHLLF